MRINANVEFEREHRLYMRLFVAAWIVLGGFLLAAFMSWVDPTDPLWWIVFCALEFSIVGAQMNARGKAEILGRMIEDERSARS